MKKELYPSCLTVLALLLLAVGCGGKTEAPEKTEDTVLPVIQKSELQLLEVSPKSKQVDALISGRVIAKNQTPLFAEVQGLILPGSLSIKPGVGFRKGQLLLAIDSEEFRLNLKAQKSAFLNTLTTILPDLKADYPDNYQTWLNYLEAIDINQSLADLPGTKSKGEKFFITSRGVYTSFYNLKAQENRLSKYSLVAPYNGTVLQSSVDVGGLVSPGQALATIISSEYELETGVSVQVATALKLGEKISFRSNEVAGTYQGTVTRIGGAIDPQTQNVAVFFQISSQQIKPGMYLRGSYAAKSYEEVFVVPSSAVGRDQAVLVLKGDVIVSQPIQTIQIMQDSTLVKGLSPKDLVILTQFADPVAGKKVKQ